MLGAEKFIKETPREYRNCSYRVCHNRNLRDEYPSYYCIEGILHHKNIDYIAFAFHNRVSDKTLLDKFHSFLLDKEASPWRKVLQDIKIVKNDKILGYILPGSVNSLVGTNLLIASRFPFETYYLGTSKVWNFLVQRGIDPVLALYFAIYFKEEYSILYYRPCPREHSAFGRHGVYSDKTEYQISIEKLKDVSVESKTTLEVGPTENCNFIFQGESNKPLCYFLRDLCKDQTVTSRYGSKVALSIQLHEAPEILLEAHRQWKEQKCES